MAAVLRSSGRTEREAADAIADADANGDGHFGFDAFRALVEASLAKTTLKLAARQGAPPPGGEVAVPRHYVVVTLLSVLDDYRKRREAAGDYPTAASVKEVYAAMQVEEEARLHDAVASRQEAERSGVEEAHMMEAMEFNSAWSRNMADFERQAQDIDEQTRQRHAIEFVRFQEEIRQRAPMRQKFSRELLNLRRVQETLAKQGKYALAPPSPASPTRNARASRPRAPRRTQRWRRGHGPAQSSAVRVRLLPAQPHALPGARAAGASRVCAGTWTRRPPSSRPTSSRRGRRPRLKMSCRLCMRPRSCR